MEAVVEELHKPARRRSSEVWMRGLDETFQADLVDMQQHSRETKGFKYSLIVIDVFLKLAWTVPVKSKSGEDIITKKIFMSTRVVNFTILILNH